MNKAFSDSHEPEEDGNPVVLLSSLCCSTTSGHKLRLPFFRYHTGLVTNLQSVAFITSNIYFNLNSLLWYMFAEKMTFSNYFFFSDISKCNLTESNY